MRLRAETNWCLNRQVEMEHRAIESLHVDAIA